MRDIGKLEIANTLLAKAFEVQQETINEIPMKVDTEENKILSLINAITIGDINKVKALLKARVNLDIRDNNGNTALHHAATKDNYNIVKLLLDHGSNPWIINKNGKNPVELANEDTIRDLLKHKQNEKLEEYKQDKRFEYNSQDKRFDFKRSSEGIGSVDYYKPISRENNTVSRDKYITPEKNIVSTGIDWVSTIKQRRKKESEHYHD